MRERWRLFFCCAYAVLVSLGAGGGEPTGTPPARRVGFLPQAVVLREVAVLEAPEPYLGFVLLGAADLNSDGFPDLVVGGDRRVQTLWGDGQGRFLPGPWVYLEVEEHEEGQRVPGRLLGRPGQMRWEPYEFEEGEGRRFLPGYVSVGSGVLADLDEDGISDVAVRGSDPEGRWSLYFLRGLGHGKFARAARVPHPEGNVLSPLWPGRKALFFTAAERDKPARLYRVDLRDGLASPEVELSLQGEFLLRWVGDWDGRGGTDLVLCTEERAWVVLGEEEGFRPGPEFIPLAEHGPIQGLAVGDLDGDGDLDLVVRTPQKVVVGLQGDGMFREAFAQDLGFPLGAHYLADLTGDGALDLLVQRSTGFWEYYLLAGDGWASFSDPTLGFVVLEGAILKPHFSDLDGDGLLDVIFAPSFGPFRTIRIYRNGRTASGVSLHPLPGALLAWGDLAGPPAPDLLVADVELQGARVLWNNGQGGLLSRPLARLGRVPLAGALAPYHAYLLLPETERLPSELVMLDTEGRVLSRFWVPEEALPSLVVDDLDGDGFPDAALPAKTLLLVLWSRWGLRSYRWPAGEVSFLASGGGRLWAVSIGEYADLVEVQFNGRAMTVSAPLLQLEALPLAMTSGDLDGDGVLDPVVLAVELGVDVEGEEAVLFPERVVAGMVLSRAGPRVEEVPAFPKDHLPWPFLGAAVARIGGLPHLVYTTSAGGGLFLLPWQGGFGEAVRVDAPGGPVLAADLDGNGEDEVLTATVGLGTLLVILWNGGGR